MLELVAHARLERLRDALVLLARLLPARDVADVRHEVEQELDLELPEGLGVVGAQEKRAARGARQLPEVEQGADAGLPQLSEHARQVGLGGNRHHRGPAERMGRDERVEVEGELPGTAHRHVDDDRAAHGRRAHGRDRGLELRRHRAHHVLHARDHALVPALGGGVEQLLAQLRLQGGELVGALGAQRGEGARQLDREVVGHRVEQAGVVLEQRVHAPPAHLDDRDDMPPEPHGDHHEARERRQQRAPDPYDLVGLLAHDLPVGEAALAQGVVVGRLDAQAHRVAVVNRDALDAAAERHEAGETVVEQRARDAAQTESVGLGEVDEGAVRLHRLGYLLEDAPEERLEVVGVYRVQYDVQRAGEAVVGAAQVQEGALRLVPNELVAAGGDREQEVRLARRAHAVAADAHLELAPRGGEAGDEVRRPVERERERSLRHLARGGGAVGGGEEEAHV